MKPCDWLVAGGPYLHTTHVSPVLPVVVVGRPHVVWCDVHLWV